MFISHFRHFCSSFYYFYPLLCFDLFCCYFPNFSHWIIFWVLFQIQISCALPCDDSSANNTVLCYQQAYCQFPPTGGTRERMPGRREEGLDCLHLCIFPTRSRCCGLSSWQRKNISLPLTGALPLPTHCAAAQYQADSAYPWGVWHNNTGRTSPDLLK